LAAAAAEAAAPAPAVSLDDVEDVEEEAKSRDDLSTERAGTTRTAAALLGKPNDLRSIFCSGDVIPKAKPKTSNRRACITRRR
jgi:hypothetical protein